MKTSTLLLPAGLLWLVAGLSVCRTGIVTWLGVGQFTLPMLIGCLLTFAAFAVMFVRMVHRNVLRIEQLPPDRRRLWHMMPLRSYLIMAFMITLGVTLRRAHCVPPAFIAWFYTGLGTALSLAGLSYLCRYLRRVLG